MKRWTLLRNVALVAAVAAFGFGLAACGGGGGGGGSAGTEKDTDLFLQKFLVVDQNLRSLGGSGSTDVYRDARLLFVFNVPVDMSSVNERTIRIGNPVAGGLFLPAVGRFEQVPGQPNQIIFNPTFSKGNVGSTADNPLGFDSYAVYQIEILSVLEASVNVKNLVGNGIVQSYRGQVQTIDEYMPTQEQPEVVSFSPADGETGVPSKADIIVTFTEPMKPSSFTIGSSFIVIDESSGRIPLGQLKFSSDYRSVTFRPVFGYGKGTDSTDPNLAGVPIAVTVSRSVTNLAGRAIPVSVSFSFRTEYDPTQPNFNDWREDFNTKNYEDALYGTPPLGNVYPLASWNTSSGPGVLRGLFTSGMSTITRHNNYVTLEPFAVGATPAIWQTICYASEVGGSSRTITGGDWFKYCPLYATTTTATKVSMGHTKSGQLTTNFATNYSDTPVALVSNYTYNIPTGSQVWQALPTFVTNFLYNGSDNLIVEIQHTGSSGGGYVGGGAVRYYAEWMENNFLNSQPPVTVQRSAHTVCLNAPYGTGTPPARTANFRYDMRLYYLIDQSEAQSKWYDSGITSPQFLDAVVIGTSPVGTTSTLTFQGAPELALSPGIPDDSRTTAWDISLANLAGSRFIRFHWDAKGNGQTNQLPEVDEIIFPYIFFD